MRVLVATPLYPPQSGGPATYAKLVETLLPQRNIDVTILSFSAVLQLPKGIRHLVYAWRCVKKAHGVDVILALDSVSVGLPALIASRITHTPLVVRVPGDHAWEQACERYGVTDTLDVFQQKKYRWYVEMLRTIGHGVVRRAARVIVPSVYMYSVVSAWVPDPNQVEVIYSGVTLPVPLEQPGSRPEGFLICTICRLVPWKGVDDLIRVVGKNSSMHLVVVGDGTQGRALQDLANVTAPGRVLFTGELPRERALGWAKVSDVFVLNSQYEGLAHVLIEAMSLGIPVIATDAGGNTEVIRDNVDGLVIKTGDIHALEEALIRTQNAPYEARARGEVAALRAQEFSIELSIQHLDRLLHDVCAS